MDEPRTTTDALVESRYRHELLARRVLRLAQWARDATGCNEKQQCFALAEVAAMLTMFTSGTGLSVYPRATEIEPRWVPHCAACRFFAGTPDTDYFWCHAAPVLGSTAFQFDHLVAVQDNRISRISASQLWAPGIREPFLTGQRVARDYGYLVGPEAIVLPF